MATAKKTIKHDGEDDDVAVSGDDEGWDVAAVRWADDAVDDNEGVEGWQH